MKKFRQTFVVLCSVCLIFCCSAFTPTESETIQLPILMYHKVALKNPGKYTVTTQQLEADIQALQSAGYTPVFLQDVIAWVNGQSSLPAKPVVLTFDDGQYNNLCYVLPLAQKYHCKYEINPVTAYSEKSMRDQDTTNPRYSNLSWEAIKTAYDSGLVEIGNHSHDMHQLRPRFGVGQKAGERLTDYQTALRADITHAQDLLTQCQIPTPVVFAYPFGKYNHHTRDILVDLGFQAILTCEEHVNTITRGHPESLYNLGRFNRSGTITTSQMLQKISH